MQAVAREMNLSETTFPTITADTAYDIRIFAPDTELPFAGHPSLGTAWTLGAARWTQTSPGATVTVEADAGGAVMGQPDPTFEDVDGGALLAALGLPGAEAVVVARAGGMSHALVATDAPIDALGPGADLGPVAAGFRAPTVGVVNRLDDRTLHVRVFGPGAGIYEDPGTGSAAGPIGLLARRVWNTSVDVTIRQGIEMQRPCRIEVHAEAGDVRVGGRVTACAEGAFTL
jgi:trans-2,3-dihydro-3-hydroxyanthranilate isomerase